MDKGLADVRPSLEGGMTLDLERAQGGAAEELLPYLDEFRQYLDLLARQRVGDELAGKLSASDLVQDTLLTATREIARFRGGTLRELQGWLRRILINHHRTARRSFWRTRKRNTARETGVLGELPILLANVPARNVRSPSSHAALNENLQYLERALERLSPQHRQIIELRQFTALPFARISVLMSVSEPAARKIWCRAICRLQRELAKLGLRAEDLR
jgi:RNA polymerase sigma-70 factor (ECF subfamily)